MLRSLWDKLRGKQPEPPPLEEKSPYDPVIPFQSPEEKEVERERKRELLDKARDEEPPPPDYDFP